MTTPITPTTRTVIVSEWKRSAVEALAAAIEATPSTTAPGDLAQWLEDHAEHLQRMEAIGALPEGELAPMLADAAALLQQQESKLTTAREALRRLVAWGGFAGYSADVVLHVADWFTDRTTGPLPPLPPYITGREGLEPTPSAAALPPAIVYECGDGVRISATNSDRTLWVVWREIAPDRECLCLARQWCIEPRWSFERDFAAFETRSRWPSAEAAWAALLEYRAAEGVER